MNASIHLSCLDTNRIGDGLSAPGRIGLSVQIRSGVPFIFVIINDCQSQASTVSSLQRRWTGLIPVCLETKTPADIYQNNGPWLNGRAPVL